MKTCRIFASLAALLAAMPATQAAQLIAVNAGSCSGRPNAERPLPATPGTMIALASLPVQANPNTCGGRPNAERPRPVPGTIMVA